MTKVLQQSQLEHPGQRSSPCVSLMAMQALVTPCIWRICKFLAEAVR